MVQFALNQKRIETVSQVFVISDLHLGHKGVLNFKRRDGSPLRDFASIAEMHDCIRERWNAVVTPQDKVYVLGDVAMTCNRETQGFLFDLPGKKRLVRGNHDLANDTWYQKAGFKSIYGVRQINKVWLTHVPMHPQSLAGRAIGNIHGHLHANFIWNVEPTYTEKHGWLDGWKDSRYFNACVENLDYTPISLEEVMERTDWLKWGYNEAGYSS